MYQANTIITLASIAAKKCLKLLEGTILAIFLTIAALPIASQLFSDQPERDQERLALAIVLKSACAGATTLAKGGGQKDAIMAAASSAGVHGMRELMSASLSLTYRQPDDSLGTSALAFTATMAHKPTHSLKKRMFGSVSPGAITAKTITEADLETC